MNMKKVIAFVCAVSLAGNGFFSGYHADSLSDSVVTVSAETLTYEDFSYKVTEDGEIEITGYNGGAAELVIPDEIDGKKVAGIGIAAFYNCTGLTSITIPESVTSIGVYAFEKCEGLTGITIPDRVTSIGGGAFEGTAWLENKRKENPLVIINNILIDGRICEGDVIIPEGVTSIGMCAFYGCEGLTGITIPESVTSIGVYAFSGCSSLKSIYGYPGSAAELYAIENNINFVPLDEKPDVTEAPVTTTAVMTTTEVPVTTTETTTTTGALVTTVTTTAEINPVTTTAEITEATQVTTSVSKVTASDVNKSESKSEKIITVVKKAVKKLFRFLRR